MNIKTIILAGLYTIAVSFCTVFVCNLPGKNRSFAEIDVQRINIVDADGNLRMVLSNEQKQHPGIVDGVDMEQRERPAGIIFFNPSGDECGGLVFEGNDQEAGLVISVDQYRNDQIMQLHYFEDTRTKQRKYGLVLWEYPGVSTFSETHPRMVQIMRDSPQEDVVNLLRAEGLLAENRLFVGRDSDGTFGLFINDSKGNPRIKLYVDADDEACFEIVEKQ